VEKEESEKPGNEPALQENYELASPGENNVSK
jgi:hypothetical protein